MNDLADKPALRIMTLNIVRSTRAPVPAWAVPDRVKATTHAALADVLDRVDPHALALQEVDRTTARHLRYGTARVGDPSLHATLLATRSPVIASSTRRFRAQGFFRDKGFSAATIDVPGFASPIRVVSVHLDAFSPRVRLAQVDELCAAIDAGPGPLVVLGDLNEDDVPRGAVSRLRDRLDLASRKADEPTYDFLGVERTLDWILVSRHFAFVAYEVLPARLSDHRAVVATLEEAA